MTVPPFSIDRKSPVVLPGARNPFADILKIKSRLVQIDSPASFFRRVDQVGGMDIPRAFNRGAADFMAFRDAAAGEFSSRQTDLVGGEIARYLNGRLDSLNVSVSAAILMYEAVRQRNKVYQYPDARM